jgi:hypothetical protein
MKTLPIVPWDGTQDIQANDPATADGWVPFTIKKGAFWGFQRQYYPLSGNNELILYWNISALPTGASFVHLTPLACHFLDYGGSQGVGPANPSVIVNDPVAQLPFGFGYSFTYDQLGTPSTGLNTPASYTIERTAVDNFAGQLGSRHPLPIGGEQYVFFFVTHDGTTNTGGMFLSARVG